MGPFRWWLGVAAAVVVALASCSAGEEDAAGTADTAAAGDDGGGEVTADGVTGAGAGAPVVEQAAQLLDAGRSVIRTAEIAVEVDDVDAAARAAVRAAEAAGGFLAEQDSSGSDGDATARLVLRVPPERFGATLDALAALGEVQSTRVGTDDVTDVVVDLEGRLAAARASVERLRALLAEAVDVPQVVAVESELARREGEVEALAGRLRTLEAQVDMATVTVDLRATGTLTDGDAAGFVAGLVTGWAAFRDVAGGAATAAGFALPFVALAVVVGVPVARWRRQRTVGTAPG